MEIFSKNKKYFFDDIVKICDKNDLITVDCLKDENMISVEEYNNGERGDCIFEFHQIKENIFKLTWQENDLNLIPQKYR